jgi:hypothetical protein
MTTMNQTDRPTARPAHRAFAEAQKRLDDLDRRIEDLRQAGRRRDDARRKVEIVAGDALAGLATPAAEEQARTALASAETAAVAAIAELRAAEADRSRLQDVLTRHQQAAWDAERADAYAAVLPLAKRWLQKYVVLREEADRDRAVIASQQGRFPEVVWIDRRRGYPIDGGIPMFVLAELCSRTHADGSGRMSALIDAIRAWIAKTENWLEEYASTSGPVASGDPARDGANAG